MTWPFTTMPLRKHCIKPLKACVYLDGRWVMSTSFQFSFAQVVSSKAVSFDKHFVGVICELIRACAEK